MNFLSSMAICKFTEMYFKNGNKKKDFEFVFYMLNKRELD